MCKGAEDNCRCAPSGTGKECATDDDCDNADKCYEINGSRLKNACLPEDIGAVISPFPLPPTETPISNPSQSTPSTPFPRPSKEYSSVTPEVYPTQVLTSCSSTAISSDLISPSPSPTVLTSYSAVDIDININWYQFTSTKYDTTNS